MSITWISKIAFLSALYIVTLLDTHKLTQCELTILLDIGYWRYSYLDHGAGLAPFRHGRRGVRERTFGEDLIPHNQRQ